MEWGTASSERAATTSRRARGILSRWTRLWKSGSSPSPLGGCALRVLLHRVLPMGRAGRCHQLPAQFQHRRGRNRAGHHLSQNRIPRAPQSLRLLCLLGSLSRLRHAARGVSRIVSRLGSAGGRGARLDFKFYHARLGAYRFAPHQNDA